jgi:deoxyribodipyrimidine photolyase-related protein
MSLVIYPNQLFNKKYFPNHIAEIILHEHPDFFTKYKFNKLKLVLHRASMKSYADELSKYYKVMYIDFNKKMGGPNKKTTYMFYQPNNIKSHGTVIDSPNFICVKYFEEYRRKTNKFFFNSFYTYMKKKLDILPRTKSKDGANRESLRGKSIELPQDLSLKIDEYIEEAINYVKKHFSDNPGPETIEISKVWRYPINEKTAKKQLKQFIENKIKNFGKYQDALWFVVPHDKSRDAETYDVLWHSCLSSSLNIGLLNPMDIIREVLDSRQNINSVEGFVRQLFWREYQLYCHIYVFNKKLVPRFPVKARLTEAWYTGKTSDEIVNYCIKKAFNTGYLHHIERLMIIGNYMMLIGMDPYHGFKWFMEFSIDSYEWVMSQNVLDMVFGINHRTGMSTMKRIYISSSSYILKMSNLARGLWCEQWDDLFHEFIKKNKKLIGYPYAGS